MVFVGYSESLASARAMALKHRYEIDPDQELIAQGMACGAAGFVGGFATDGSLSKTSVADLAGQKMQMASLVNAVFVLLTMLFLASLFENLPAATLGAVVIDAMLGVVTSGPCGAISGEPRRLGVLHGRDARSYPRRNQQTAIQFLDYLLERLPFRVEVIQTDNGPQFGSSFHWQVLDNGASHVYIKPRTPRLNGKV